MTPALVAVSLFLLAALGLIVGELLRQRAMHRWIFSYLRQTPKRLARRPEQIHLLLCITDHFEPNNSRATAALANQRVQRWVTEYPMLFGQFRDSDGKPPRYSFFYPAEEYVPDHLDALAELCRAGFGEVEVHLHHHEDNANSLHRQLEEFKRVLVEQHGLLSRDKDSGKIVYSFIHGNWALCNAFGDGRYCGVNEEIEILRKTGCCADFTMPSAPSITQTSKINSIYYAFDRPGRPRSHDTGIDAGTPSIPEGGLMLIQGPLVLDWRQRKKGIVPAIENGCLQDTQPPSITRLDAWLKARIQIPSRPDWYFVKLHTHGCEDAAVDTLLGEPMVQFHQDLAQHAKKHPQFHFHYVTAREMVNLARAAEDGYRGSVDDARDYQFVWNAGEPQALDPGCLQKSSR